MSEPTQADGVVYRLVRELSEIPHDLKLRNIEWGVLMSITGEHPAGLIGKSFDLDQTQLRRVFSRLLETGLIEEQPVTWREYLRANALNAGPVGDDQRNDLRKFLRAGVTLPAPTPMAFTPLETPRPEVRRKRLSLKVLMRHILDRAPDANSGQLDVYRVFIRVDTKLLKRSGIDTLRFEDDREVDDPELQQAIGRSLERTLGMSVPSDAFVDRGRPE